MARSALFAGLALLAACSARQSPSASRELSRADAAAISPLRVAASGAPDARAQSPEALVAAFGPLVPDSPLQVVDREEVETSAGRKRSAERKKSEARAKSRTKGDAEAPEPSVSEEKPARPSAPRDEPVAPPPAPAPQARDPLEDLDDGLLEVEVAKEKKSRRPASTNRSSVGSVAAGRSRRSGARTAAEPEAPHEPSLAAPEPVYARRAERAWVRPEVRQPSFLDIGRDASLRIGGLEIEATVEAPRVELVLQFALQNPTQSPLRAVLEYPLPEGLELSRLSVAGAKLEGARPSPSSNPPRRWSEPEPARWIPAPRAETASGRLPGASTVARTGRLRLPEVAPGAWLRVRLGLAGLLEPTKEGLQLAFRVPELPQGVLARVNLRSALAPTRVAPERWSGLAGESEIRAVFPMGEQVSLRGSWDDDTDAWLLLAPSAAAAAERPRTPDRVLFVVDTALHADLEARAAELESVLSGPGAPAQFALLAYDVEAVWLTGERFVPTAGRAAALDALRRLRAEGASSFASVGRALEQAQSWLHAESLTAVWMTDGEPSWGATRVDDLVKRHPVLGALAWRAPTELWAAEALLEVRAVSGKAGLSGLEAAGLAVDGAAEWVAEVRDARRGPMLLAAGLAPRGRPVRIARDGSTWTVPAARDGSGAARAFAELDTRARGARDPHHLERCARFAIPCPGLVLALGVPARPVAPEQARLSPSVAAALEASGVANPPGALVSRPPVHPRRVALERRPPTAVGGWLELAHVRAGEGDTLGAVRALSSVVAEDPGDADRARLVAYALLALNQHASAVELLEGVRALRPFEARSHFELGLALERAGRRAEAAAAYATVYESGWPEAPGSLVVAALRRELRLLDAASGPAVRARAERLRRRYRVEDDAEVQVMLSWSSPSIDLDLWVLEPDGHRAEPGVDATAAGGRHRWNVIDGAGPELYLGARPGSYDALLRAGPVRTSDGLPSGSLLWVDVRGQPPRLVSRWVPGSGLVASLATFEL